MESQPQPETTENRISLYRERISSENYLGESLEEIDRLASGEGIIELTETERIGVLEYETDLEEKLWDISSPAIRSISLDPEYLLTRDGRDFFIEKTGVVDLPQTVEEIVEFLYSNVEIITGMGKDDRRELQGLAKKWRDEYVFEQLITKVDEKGYLTSTDADLGERLGIVLDNDKLSTKNARLRELKAELKNQYKNLQKHSNIDEAKGEIIKLYLHRINLMLVTIASEVRKVSRKADLLGIDSLDESERALLKIDIADEGSEYLSLRSESKRERDTSRYDRFVHGASSEYVDHERPQLDVELIEFAEVIAKRWLEENLDRRRQVEALGLDYERLVKKNIPAEDRKKIIEEHLLRLGVLNTEQDKEEDAETPPEQKKYKVGIKKGSRSAAVDQKYKKLSIPDIDASIITLLSVEAGHEVGHVLQAINGSEIPLKIFGRLGAGGNTAFSEAGAIYVQGQITQELFGFEVANHPHYVRAMVEKLRGGDYLDTVMVFYQSSIEPFQIKFQNGEIDEAELQEETKRQLMLAIDRCQRLFRGGTRASQEPSLASSKDTAYVEQLKIAEALAARGQERLLLVRGMSPETIIVLLKLGFLKLDEIKEPNYDYIKSVWEKEKSKYILG